MLKKWTRTALLTLLGVSLVVTPLLAASTKAQAECQYRPAWKAEKIGNGWRDAWVDKILRAGDLDRNGYEDMLLTTRGGRLRFYPMVSQTKFAKPRYVGHGWNNMLGIYGGIDFNGDKLPDILGIDLKGNLYYYPGAGNGWFRQKVFVKSGFQKVTNISVSQRGFNGHPVIMGVRADGTLRAYQSNGKGKITWEISYSEKGWENIVKTGMTGDVNGDGNPDMWVIMKNGDLRLYTFSKNGGSYDWYRLGWGWQGTTDFMPNATGKQIRAVFDRRSSFPHGDMRQYTLRSLTKDCSAKPPTTTPTTDKPTPEPTAPTEQVNVSVQNQRFDTGTYHTCAITSDDTGVKCWGRNTNGQIGDGSAAGDTRVLATPVAVTIPYGGTIKEIAAGDRHTCALKTNGQLYCWGDNTSGQLGDGGKEISLKPKRVGTMTFTQVTAGAHHTCAVGSDNKPYCWGKNGSSQLGNGSNVDKHTPGLVSGAAPYVQMAAGESHTCGLKQTGIVDCWGSNSAGQLGEGSPASSVAQNKPVQVKTNQRFTSLVAGSAFNCGVTGTKTVWCWGSDSFGQIGDGGTADLNNYAQVPKQVVSITGRTSLGAGVNHACASNGASLSCWGDNSRHQFGSTAAQNSYLAPIISNNVKLSGIAQIRGGKGHTCAQTADKTKLYCWGDQSSGQLGNGEYSANLSSVIAALNHPVAIGL